MPELLKPLGKINFDQLKFTTSVWEDNSETIIDRPAMLGTISSYSGDNISTISAEKA